MKAIIIEQYGPPDVLQLREIEQPQPEAGEVLVKVHAAGTNPADWHFFRGEPFLVRMAFGLQRPKVTRTGNDFAGTVVAAAPDVTAFQPGDAVFGKTPGLKIGAFAEYVTVRATSIVSKPESISFEEAAGVPIAAVTALQGLRDSGGLQAGQTVLVNGASGGVGTFAVQIAKALGASEVTGVSSDRNHELVRSLGADHMIDYKTTDFTRTGKQYDLIFDAVANRSARAYARAVKPGGKCVIVGFTNLLHLFTQTLLMSRLVTAFTDKHIGKMATARVTGDELRTLSDMLSSGQIRTVIDRTYPLEATAEAIRYLEQGHARGKVIVTMA